MDDDVRAPLERPAQVRARQRVVDDERDAVLARDAGEHLQVDHEATRVGEALGEDELRAGRDGGADGGLVAGVDQAPLPAESGEGVAELGEADPPYRNRDATKWSPGSIRV